MTVVSMCNCEYHYSSPRHSRLVHVYCTYNYVNVLHQLIKVRPLSTYVLIKLVSGEL